MRVAWVSCRPLPEPDPDEVEGLGALRARGHQVEVVPWHDPDARWGAFDALALRSPWDYPERPSAFRAWLEARSADPLWNPAPVALWNLDKAYLLELEAAGVPVVPTARGGAGDSAAALARARGWTEVVVKPAVGAGSMGVRRFADLGEASAHARGLGAAFLVQAFLPSFADPGERAIVWVEGRARHVVVKRPRLDGDVEQVRLAGRPSAEEIAIAEAAIAAAPGPLHYARVDVVRGAGGQLRVSELELIEPSLFWSLGGVAGEALEAWVDGLEARARRRYSTQ